MTIIEEKKDKNGSHNENTLDFNSLEFLPDGWAILPESVGTPITLKNYPFGDITVEEIDGVPTVTSWTPGTVPDPDPEEKFYTSDDLMAALLGMEVSGNAGGGGALNT